MFFKMIKRNTVRNHKENTIFMISLIISVVAFYVVLSLRDQDIMRYLETLESDAIQKLFAMIIVLYGFTLFVLFTLVHFTSRYQMERRSHEFGIYMMMGMKKSRLLGMMLAEDITSSVIALLAGLPIAVLVTEVVSLVTVKMVGIGFLGHQSTFSPSACLVTALGFFLIKLVSFVFISFELGRKEVGDLLTNAPSNIKKKKTSARHLILLVLGVLILAAAYYLAVSGIAWIATPFLGGTLVVGIVGTLLLFKGLRYVIDRIASKDRGAKLHVFDFRQIEDTVTMRSFSMAICSLLVLMALCCLGAGLGIFSSFDIYSEHNADYSFEDTTEENVRGIFDKLGKSELIKDVLVTRYSNIGIGEMPEDEYDGSDLIKISADIDRDHELWIWQSTWNHAPHLIPLSDYNLMLKNAGLPEIELEDGQAEVCCDFDFANKETSEFAKQVFMKEPHIKIAGDDIVLKGELHTAEIAVDGAISFSYGLIMTDSDYEKYSAGKGENFVNVVLDEVALGEDTLIKAYDDINRELDKEGVVYECYQGHIGRQLFYMVAASYVTIYLALIFLVVSNTILGVQFLMAQQRSSGRYKTLVKLGATHESLCKSSSKQINWYFGIPVTVACMSAIFGVRSLFSGILSSSTKVYMGNMLVMAGIVILVLCLIELFYITMVKRSSNRYLKTLMTPERVE